MKTKRKVPPRDFVSISAQGFDETGAQSSGLCTIVDNNGPSDHASSSVSNKRHKVGQPVESNTCSVTPQPDSSFPNIAGAHLCQPGIRPPLIQPITSGDVGCSVSVNENVVSDFPPFSETVRSHNNGCPVAASESLDSQPFRMRAPPRKRSLESVGPTVAGIHRSVRRKSDSPSTFMPDVSSSSRVHGRSGPPLSYQNVRRCDHICEHCRARFWYDERIKSAPKNSRPIYHRCCKGGRVVIRTYQIYPEYIQLLLSNRHFMENIRAYNQMFSMTSLGARIDDSINIGRGPYVFKISGQLYHWLGSLCPAEGDTPRFLQLYVYDTENEVGNRLAHFGGNNSGLRQDIIECLIELLDNHNALVQLFRTAREKLKDDDVPPFKVRLYSVVGERQYELLTGDTLGAIVYEGDPQTDMEFDIIIEDRFGPPQHVDKLHPSYMALQFPLLFVYGEDGYSKNMKMVHVPGLPVDKDKRLTIKAYYSYMLHDRVGSFNYLSKTGRLFQQYIVTAFCAIEQCRIDWVREHQNDIRNEYLSGIFDAIRRGDSDGSDCGGRLILPQSFTGSPRYMYAHYLDALAICRVNGNPSYFITFMCNVKWPEILDYMLDFPYVTTADRADIVDRIFELKIHAFVTYLRDAQPFGKIIAIVYTVEFQKRGLPHCHTLIWVDESNRIRTQQDIDNYICAELPSPELDYEGHRIVAEFMIQGPCGDAFRNAACMKNTGACTKRFPKDYSNHTYTDDSGFVHYRRRDTGITTTKQNIKLDNGYVVPYNLNLLKKFYAHINVEHCGWTMLIKYLFKYISKGTDKIAARVVRTDDASAGDPSSSSQPLRIRVDEIKNYLDSRYIGPHEACWILFEFDIHYRDPAVQTLAVHAENMQRVVFRERENLRSVVTNPNKKKTTLTEWLLYNKHNTDGRHLTYLNFPSEYVWVKKDKY